MNSESPLQELITAVVALAAALAACSQPSEPVVADTMPAASAIAGPMSDAAIVTRIHEMLQADEQLKATRVSVASQGGRVTLSGSSPDPESQARVARMAAMVPGVRSVYNRVVVTEHG